MSGEDGKVRVENGRPERLCVAMALSCVERAYPVSIQLGLRRDEDARPARVLTPAFYGCFDWHSAVHAHWTIARGIGRGLPAEMEREARERLGRTLAKNNVEREVAFLAPRPTFERPYGLAWLLALHGELAGSADAELASHGATVEPLARLVAERFAEYLPKLSYPVRSGVHSQTAFALGLVLDWARARGERGLAALVETRTRELYGEDHGYAVHLEPSGEDFLSPSLGAADLVARVLSAEELAGWLDRTMPALGRDEAPVLTPVSVTDPTDGRLAHLDGLNLSRAWMLARVAGSLPSGDARVTPLRALSAAHGERGLAPRSAGGYEGAHWLGTFAMVLLTLAL